MTATAARRLFPAAIPAELKNLEQWVGWAFEQRGARSTKTPRRTNGLYASSTDPASWASFHDALAAYDESPELDGIGFVLKAGGPYVGVDLDHALSAEGRPLPWATDIIHALNSYTEVSPSGHGFRLFVKAELPAHGRRRGNVEMYDSGRFVTVTGAHVPGTPTTVEQRNAEILAVHEKYVARPIQQLRPISPPRAVETDDRELLIRALQASNGARFGRLWSGDTSAYGGDHSAADLALCAHLAFWTGGDADRMDRLFRASGLFREKWDALRGAETYGARTIAVALQGMRGAA